MARYLEEKNVTKETMENKIDKSSNKSANKRKKGADDEVKLQFRSDNDNKIVVEEEYVYENINKNENDCNNANKCNSDVKSKKSCSTHELQHDEISINSKIEKWNNLIMADKFDFCTSDGGVNFARNVNMNIHPHLSVNHDNCTDNDSNKDNFSINARISNSNNNSSSNNNDNNNDNDNRKSSSSNNNNKYKNQIYQRNRNSEVYWCNKSIENLGHLFTLDSHVAVEALNAFNGFVPIVTATASASVSTQKDIKQSTYDIHAGKVKFTRSVKL